jgi:hypothetical protein
VRFHDTRYTGANRCWPCSLLNGGVAAAVAGALLLAGRPVLAGATAVVALAAIGLRGYLIPGTPRLTRRLPDPVLAAFGKREASIDLADADAAAALRSVDVLTDDLTLAPDVREEIAATAREYVDDDDRLREVVVRSFPEVVEVSVGRSLGGGETWRTLDDDEMTVVQWDARATAALDAAAAALLEERLPSWTDRPLDERRAVLAFLRHDAETCPACGGAFTTSDGPRVACCGGRSLAGDRRCSECGYALVDYKDLPTDGELTPEAADG